jgi:UDP-glucose 4-epimerase
MRILVIGGGGFIGHHLAHKLTAAGHEVVILGRSANPSRPLPCSARYVQGDLGDAALLRSLLPGVDAVAHMASATIPATGDQNPVFDVTTNLIGTIKLLEVMADVGCKRLLFLSSGGTVYGIPKKVPLEETHPREPICSYGIVKSAIESYIDQHRRHHRLSSVILRASNPYGPHQGVVGRSGVIWTYLNLIHREQPIEVWGDGTIIRDYIYISDLTQLCLAVVEGNQTGVYNAGSGAGTSIKQIIDVVHQVTKRATPVLYRPGRELDVNISVLSIDKARSDFEWEPRVSLLEGISRTWHVLKAN